MNKTKRIDLRVSESELVQIDKKATQARLSRTDYLIKSAMDKPIVVFDGGQELAHQLFKIGTNVNQLKMLAHQGKIEVVYLDKFTGEVNAIWQLLNSLINPTAPTQE